MAEYSLKIIDNIKYMVYKSLVVVAGFDDYLNYSQYIEIKSHVISDTGKKIPVKRIGNHAFANRTLLREVIIPDTVTEIGVCAFYGCSYLKDVKMAKRAHIFYENCFGGCESLESIEFSTYKDIYIHKDAFSKTGIKEVVFPDVGCVVYNLAFYDCKSLKKVTFLGVPFRIIQGNSFCECPYLTSTIFPKEFLDGKEAHLSNGLGVSNAPQGLSALWEAGLKTREVLLRIPSV